MIICVCQNVSERDIGRAVAQGCRSFAGLQAELELGKACGTCLGSAHECFTEQRLAQRSQPVKPDRAPLYAAP
jgi:bacterioferritin-associated ferredoxin